MGCLHENLTKEVSDVLKNFNTPFLLKLTFLGLAKSSHFWVCEIQKAKKLSENVHIWRSPEFCSLAHTFLPEAASVI